MKHSLVSIIMPTYNDAHNLELSVQSVLSQTYQDWELLVVDDCSTDETSRLLERLKGRDARIKTFRTDQASGSPTLPRNIGVEKAQGRYIAFLDSDDLWLPAKLEHQIAQFKSHQDAAIVYSNYRNMTEAGVLHRRIVKAPASADYYRLLKGNVMGCLTIMYDTEKVGKQFFPSCGHEDYALWLSMLRKGNRAYNTNTVEACYRLKNSSVSSNKFRAMGWQWHIYTEIERLGTFRSMYYFVHYAVRAVIKRLK